MGGPEGVTAGCYLSINILKVTLISFCICAWLQPELLISVMIDHWHSAFFIQSFLIGPLPRLRV